MSLLVTSVLSLLYHMDRNDETSLASAKIPENRNRTNKNLTDFSLCIQSKRQRGCSSAVGRGVMGEPASLNTRIDVYIERYACVSGTDLSLKE